MSSKKKTAYIHLVNHENTLDIDELFLDISRNADAFKSFNSDSVVDSMILEECKTAPVISGLNTAEEWNELLDNALELKKRKYVFNAKVMMFQTRVRLLIAACFIGVIALGVLGIFSFKNSEITLSTKSPIYTDNDSNVSIVNSTVHETENLAKVINTQSSGRIVMFDKKTSGVLSEKTSMTVTKKDTSVYLSITSGAVLFTVEKGRYRSFTVVTPHAKIRVTGTTFRIDAMENFTKVSVVEGSVKVIHESQSEHDTISLEQGNVAVADSSKVQFFENDIESKIHFPERKLLDSFIKSAIETTIEKTDSISDETVDSLLNVIKNTQEKPGAGINKIFRVATQLKDKSRFNDAITLYEYIIDNCDSSDLRNEAAGYLTWSLVQMKIEKSRKSADNDKIFTNEVQTELGKVDYLRLFPKP